MDGQAPIHRLDDEDALRPELLVVQANLVHATIESRSRETVALFLQVAQSRVCGPLDRSTLFGPAKSNRQRLADRHEDGFDVHRCCAFHAFILSSHSQTAARPDA